MTTVLHLQKVAGISGSEAHLLSLLPRLRDRVARHHSVDTWADGILSAASE